MSTGYIEACVVWSTPHVQDLVRVQVPHGSTIAGAIACSGLVEAYSLNLHELAVAVFGKRRRFDSPVAPGDRIELLRPLPADPKDSRRRRAQRQRTSAPDR